ncbi:MAG: coproporphyrinogen III oxidase, partial [Chloroflexi bacterium]|nr:coproporphyrinogen III oxidase [Chloroflexota bacterium]
MALAGLYVHIPFCLAKCAYCDFVSFAGLEPLYGAYVEALLREIALVAPRWAGFSFDTLFIGGGTPMVLPTASLEAIIAACREGF